MTELPDRLIVMAMEAEGQGLFERADIPVLYCGIGKINATHVLTRKLAEYRYAKRPMPLIVNFGSAGSHSFVTGSVVACREFIQRDMDVSGLGLEVGVTPFDELPSKLAFPESFHGEVHGVCGSGDRFETGQTKLSCDVIDMEAYALAKVCRLEGARFACGKYITDGADHTAASDWQANLPKAAEQFRRLYGLLREG